MRLRSTPPPARRVLPLLVAASLLVFGVLADAALRVQARLARAAEDEEHERAASQAGLAVRATLARIEEAAVDGEDAAPAEAWRIARPPAGHMTAASWRPAVEGLDRAQLAVALESTGATAGGLPLAAIAALALGDDAATAGVRDALLAGRLAVAVADVPRLATRLGAEGDPRVGELAARLRRTAAAPPMPSIPAFARSVGAGTVGGWAVDGQDVVHYETSVEALLEAAGVGERVHVAVADARERSRAITVPDVDGLVLALDRRRGESVRVVALRVALWAAVVAAIAALAASARALAQQARAVFRERQFLAAVTHELRTPVAALRLFGETLAEGRGDPREYGALITRESERLEVLTERALTAARLDAAPAFTDVEPGSLVAAAIQRLAVRAERAGKVLSARMEPQLPLASWDCDAVERALVNLVANALQHGGERIEVSAARDADRVRLAVHDDGPGIRRRDRERVFEPFQRHGRGGGAGLGLYLVEQVARAHDGRVELATDEGRGCTLTLVLPLRPRTAVRAGAGSGGEAPA